MTTKTSLLSAATVALAVAVSGGSALASGQCDSSGSISGDTFRSHASYSEQKRPKRTVRMFEVEIEIGARARLKVGQTVVVLVDGKTVGSLPLQKDRNGDFEIDLKYNSLRTSGPNRFPDNFPKISGSLIAVKIGNLTQPLCVL